MFQIKVVEKIKTHFMFNNFFPENRAIEDVMSKHVVEPQAEDDDIVERCMPVK
jgi:hypothetical protein